MANIVGQPLESYVIKQIKSRQKLHGAGAFSDTFGEFRTDNQLNILNSNTAWIKLASGVSVSDSSRLTAIGVDRSLTGMELAKKYVLFGGTSEFKNQKLETRKGFLTFSDDQNNPSINDQSTYFQGEFGYSPMPGIVSADIKTLNRGSIKKATIKLKAHNKVQFGIIDLLYLRLGYTVLLEWGNTMYSEDGINRELVRDTLLEDKFFKAAGKSSYLEFLGGTNSSTIAGYRNSYDGNYDGLLGKISNFNWSFQPDGSYDIELTVISLGDVVESLKTNISIDRELSSWSQDAVAPADPAEKNKNNNAISFALWLFKYFDNNSFSRGGSGADVSIVLADASNTVKNLGNFLNVDPSGTITTSWNFIYTIDIIGPGGNKREIFKPTGKNQDDQAQDKLVTLWNSNFSGAVGITVNKTNVVESGYRAAISFQFKKQNYEVVYEKEIDLSSVKGTANPISDGGGEALKINLDTPGTQYYLRFYYLLKYIKEKIIPKIETGGSSHKNKPSLINIDNTVGSNFMYFIPNGISLDPRICIVRNDHFLKASNTEAKVYPELEEFKHTDNSAKIMNIYLNFDFITNSLESSLDERGDVNLYDFLSSLCTGINKAMGSINNLEPIIDEDNNTLKIIDSTPIPGISCPPSSEQYSIQLYGYDKQKNFYESTFVRKVDLKTAITPEYATMITVGATANGYVKGTEATAFSRWNKGLRDRFNDELLPGNEASLNNSGANEAEENYRTKFLEKVANCYGYASDFKSFVDDWIESNISVVSEYYKYIIANSKTSSGGTVGFIPFKLSLTMDGISGIKIYNKIVVDTSFLPSNYGDTLDFIITGVSHNLRDNDWETTLETTVIPKTNIIPYTPPKYPAPPTSGTRPSTCPVITFKLDDSSKGVSREEVAVLAKNIFPDLTDKALAGFLGHLNFESGGESNTLNPTAYNSAAGGCGAIGIAQWRGTRQENLFNFAKRKNIPVEDIETQLKFAREELVGSYPKVWNLLKSPNLTLIQYTAITHISYGLGNSDPYGYYKTIKSLNDWKTVYLNKGGNTPTTIPKRYTNAYKFLQLLK